MDSRGLVWQETSVQLVTTGWTLIVPSDYERVWLAVTGAATGNTWLLSMHSGGVNTQGAFASSGQGVCPVFKLTEDFDGPMVWQEWWGKSTTAPIFVVVWTLRRQGEPIKRKPPGLLLPERNGRTVDDLSGYDPAAMDTLLNRMRQQTRRFQRV